MAEKRWVFKSAPEQDAIDNLSNSINVSPPIASILLQRGVDSFEAAKNFFRPSLDMLHDPFLMKDMDKAVDRVIKAFDSKEKILVYGDYDVDGTTSVALFYGFINSFHFDSAFYIPDRYKEGYGISKQGIDWASENGYSLIVALDCGIKSNNLVQYATSLGIDFIICDHHRPGDSIPEAIAVLDPKREDCPYPFKELPGCGIGFKLIQAIVSQRPRIKANPYDFLDLVVVSIASDIVPIVGENRTLAHFGLIQLNKNPRPGLKALMRLARNIKELTITGIVFGLAPRINAAGRIAHAHGAVDLLLAESEDEAYHFGEKLNVKNNQRRDFDSAITEEAVEMIANNVALIDAKTTVLFKNDWHKGVIGIVASRCIEKYYRPTIILTESEGKATGSARSVPGFDVYEAIDSCSHLLDHFGGHKYAAGLTLDLDKVEEFQKLFETVVSQTIADEMLIPQVEIDAKILLDSITGKFYNILKQMEPYGPENMTPIFMAEELYLASSLTVIKEKHLKFKVGQTNNTSTFDCIGFGFGHLAEEISQDMLFKMTFTIEENEFRGVTTLQLQIKDIKYD
ncbi:single-stranded-DNA-specific exonuclease RecJ [Fulvivirga lutimaris]|uniref:single-stranded-DNA-specific exonuclease RecJ n=1 Tax=Fulvivirga lutimaris TaxID=1819566 RepID=UPI0012BBC945|nr:single-stranded-DNA-specific exonuclease RecJ [Fulvivirga lutimaris]MTI39133.1 single-stranded-DNA-specific exonuclease RecJ [Fulvivirga lutimaris]